MSRSRHIPTQDEIQEEGRCGHGYRPSDGNHCGEPSAPGAVFGYCAAHAEEFDARVARIDGSSS